MYLKYLDIDKKHLFLDLEILLANADGNFDKKEKAIIDYHCEEMHIDNNNYINEQSFNEILDKLKLNFSEEEKRAFLLELIAVAVADEKYDKEEKVIFYKILDAFAMPVESMDIAFHIVENLQKIYCEMDEYVRGN